MKHASWVCCATSFAALLTAGCERVPDDTKVTRVEYATEWFGNDPLPESPLTPPGNLAWRTITLPYFGDLERNRTDRSARSARAWIRIVDRPDAPGPRALAYAAFMATGSDATLYVDGRRVAASDPTLSNDWNRPMLFQLPYGEARSEHVIEISFDCWADYTGCLLPSMRVGPLRSVTAFYERQNFLRIGVPQIGSVSILIVGAFALFFWVRRRHEVAYLLFFCASLLWTFRTLHYHLSRYPEPERVFWWITINSLSWLSVLVYFFVFRLYGERRKVVERVLIGAASLSTFVALWHLVEVNWIYEQIQYALQAAISLFVSILLSIAAWRRRTREHIAMAVALWICLAFGIHDFLLETCMISIEGVYLLPYAALPLFGAFIYAMARRYRGAIEDTERLNASLEERLAERTRELDASHALLRRVEVESARNQERQRLMRDMHDGLGSSLMSSLALAERGETDPDFVLGTLREAVDELKLTIDSLEPIESDLVTLLANLRYRLGPRLTRAGLAIEWDMPDLPKLVWMDAAAALQILRIVQESLTNVLKHARATKLRVSAATVDGHVRVTIADDGVGFDVDALARAPSGRGLRNIRQRAEQLGARIEITSRGTGTILTLLLPVERRRAPR